MGAVSMGIRITANAEDALSASSIYAKSWKASYRGMLSDALLDGIPLDFWVPAFTGNFSSHRFETAIIRENGLDIGAGGYGLSRDYEEADVGEITSIYFLPEAWGKGGAKQLLDFMIHELCAMQCRKVHLWTIQENARAQRFYEKCGFKKTGNEKVISFKGEEVTDIEYARTLEGC